ncbi:MAG TPA: hypothetical protein VI316_03775 [Candidatus Dormibacteraeota bacterium]
MDATLGHARRHAHGMLLFVIALATALALGIAGGYGIRAWTSSTSATVTTRPPVVQPAVHPVPAPLPDRSDISTRTQPVINRTGDSRLGGPH